MGCGRSGFLCRIVAKRNELQVIALRLVTSKGIMVTYASLPLSPATSVKIDGLVETPVYEVAHASLLHLLDALVKDNVLLHPQ